MEVFQFRKLTNLSYWGKGVGVDEGEGEYIRGFQATYDDRFVLAKGTRQAY